MRIVDTRVLRGTNVFHSKPVLLMTLDLEDLNDRSSAEIPGFTERLTAALPGLWEHRCSPGYPGGFIERLHRGTYMAHIIEHIAIELSTPVGIEVGYGKTVYAGKERLYNVVVRYQNEDAMKYLLHESVCLAQAFVDGSAVNIDAIIKKAIEIKEDTELGPSSKAIVSAAERRSIPWRRVGSGSLIELGYGKYRRRVQTAVTDHTSLIAADLVQDKEATKRVLREAAVNVPDGFSAGDEKEVREKLSSLRAPFVVKPVDGHHGQGVTMGLKTIDEVLRACKSAWEYSSRVLIEEQCEGKDYRVLVVGGKFVAAAERTPAHVIGDGKSTIRELIAIANRDPRRGVGHGNVLTYLEFDEKAEDFLHSQGLTPESVPATWQMVKLCQTANLSTGGTAKDVTDEVHESVRSYCERISRVVGLDICGIDLIHKDARHPIDAGTGVIEVNAGPGLRAHVAPSEGQSRDVGAAILEMLYPPGTPSRIPLVAVTGTNGKTTVARLVAHIASTDGAVVGLTCSDGIMIGGACIEKGDTTGPRSARLVLSDPSVDIAVLETARGGLLRNGLGYDWSDVGVITNLRPDHIGQDGIEDLSDIIRVKSIIAERVRDGGTIVLNADDLETSRLIETAKLDVNARDIVFYSLKCDHPLIRDHVRQGGTAFCVSEGWLCELTDAELYKIARTADLKFAFGGTAQYQVSNALAAAAAARGIGLTREQITKGLVSFQPSLHNAGRSNVYRIADGYVVLDYGHNPDAISAVAAMVKEWNPSKAKAVVGLPGDRADSLLQDNARAIASGFDSLILRDDLDLRGREPGEVPRMISELVEREFPHVECRTVQDDKAAIEVALANLQAEEVLVIFYDEFDTAMSALRSFDPVPLDGLPTSAAQDKNDNPSTDNSPENKQTSAKSIHVPAAPLA